MQLKALASLLRNILNYLKHLNDGNFGRGMYNTNQSNFLIPHKPTTLCKIIHPKNYRKPGILNCKVVGFYTTIKSGGRMKATAISLSIYMYEMSIIASVVL